MTLSTSLAKSVWSNWQPPAKANHQEWIPKNVRLPDETETPGLFDTSLFPHVCGPGSPLEAADDEHVRELYFPWASRLGKTITGGAILESLADQAPRPAMVARESKEAVDDLIRAQLYPLFDACRRFRGKLPPKRLRDPKHGIRFPKMRIRRAFPGSAGSMAGFPACYGLASEVSKWPKRKSSEADPIYLFRKRGLLFPYTSKYIFESTPGTKSECNITSLCSAPGVDVRFRVVPCPQCGTYQELIWGGSKVGPGLKWEKKEGLDDPQTAEDTAFYQCVNGCRIENKDRATMLRKGVWLSDGQEVTKQGKIKGKRPEASAVAFGHPTAHPFSSLYSLLVTGWGQIAREFCQLQGDREGIREFYNQTLGVCWDPHPYSVQPDELIVRMSTPEPLGIAPAWSSFATVGVDVGRSGDELLFYWWASAWGQHGRGQLLGCGLVIGAQEFREFLPSLSWRHADGGPPLHWSRCAIDSGSITEKVYAFADSLRRSDVICLKGSSDDPTKDFADDRMLEMYKLGMRRAGVNEVTLQVKIALKQWDLLIPNTRLSQEWCQNRIDGFVSQADPSWYSIPQVAFEIDPLANQSLVSHLMGDQRDDHGRWKKRWERQDFRDAWRYSMVAAWLHTEQGKRFDNLPPRVRPTLTRPTAQAATVTPYLRSDLP